MDVTLNELLREAILAAQRDGRDMKATAEKAAQAYASGLAAYEQTVTRPAAPPVDHGSVQ